jgi:hypothetical protein
MPGSLTERELKLNEQHMQQNVRAMDILSFRDFTRHEAERLREDEEKQRTHLLDLAHRHETQDKGGRSTVDSFF